MNPKKLWKDCQVLVGNLAKPDFPRKLGQLIRRVFIIKLPLSMSSNLNLNFSSVFLSIIKSKVNEHGVNVTDNSPLNKIKTAIQNLKVEILLFL